LQALFGSFRVALARFSHDERGAEQIEAGAFFAPSLPRGLLLGLGDYVSAGPGRQKADDGCLDVDFRSGHAWKLQCRRPAVKQSGI